MIFTILIIICIIASIFLAFAVLIQNPKGGGISGTFGGAANQVFGYKRSTDEIEKITWGLVVVITAMCLASAAFSGTTAQANTTGGNPDDAKMRTQQDLQQQDNPGTSTQLQGDQNATPPDNGSQTPEQPEGK